MHADDDWPLLAFLLELRTDQAQGRLRPLREYLAAHPAHEAAIAREFLRSQSNGTAPEPTVASLGPFVLGAELGHGAEGTVYLAHDPVLDRRAAVKLLHASTDDLAAARMLRAAQALGRLDHPHLVRVLCAGRHGQRLWIATEFVPGPDLQDELERRRMVGNPWTGPEIGRLLAPVAAALQHAHAHGIVHRDVKPGNLLLRNGRDLVLADFGLARDDGRCSDLTAAGELRGTPCYMAPERLRGHEASRATDVYALGLVAGELATLHHPFRAATEAATVAAALRGDPWRDPRWQRLSPDLAAVLATATSADPRHRYATAAAFAADLQALADGRPVQARRPNLWQRGIASVRQRPTASVIAIGGVLALVSVTVLSQWFLDRERGLRAAAVQHAREVRALTTALVADRNSELVGGDDALAQRARWLELATATLDRLAEAQPDDVPLQRERCLAWLRAGSLAGHDAEPNLAEPAVARRCYATAAAIAEAHLGTDPRQATLLAASRLFTAMLDLQAGAVDGAPFHSVIASLQGDNREQRQLRGAAFGCLGLLARDARDFTSARQWLAAADREFAADPADPAALVNRTANRTLLATVLADDGEPGAAEHLLREALADLPSVGGQGHRAALLRPRAQAERTLANVLLLLGRANEARRWFGMAVDRYRALAEHDPSDRGARQRLADTLVARAAALAWLGDPAAAAADRAQATALLADRPRPELRAGH